MALFSNLPVYKLGYDVLLEIYNRTKSFPREFKFTIGEKMKEESLNMLINVYKANKSRDKTRTKYIEIARRNVEVLRLLLRVAKDLMILGIKGFVFLNTKIEELSKQLTAWQKYMTRAGN